MFSLISLREIGFLMTSKYFGVVLATGHQSIQNSLLAFGEYRDMIAFSSTAAKDTCGRR